MGVNEAPTTQLGAVSIFYEDNGIESVPNAPDPLAVSVQREAFQSRLTSLCERDGEIDVLFAPTVALLARSVYSQNNLRPGYVLVEDAFEVVTFDVDLPDSLAEYRNSEMVVGIPRGFVFDAQSIHPAIYYFPGLGGLLNPVRNEVNSSLVHDWLYAVGERNNKDQRTLADRAYKQLLKEYKVRSLATNLASWAIQTGGKRAFGRANELRFYDICHFNKDKCNNDDDGYRVPIRTVVSHLREDAALRTRMNELSICIRKNNKIVDIGF